MKIENKFMYLNIDFFDFNSLFTDRKLFLLDFNIKTKYIRPSCQITENAYSKKYGFRKNIMKQFGKILWFGFYLYIGKLTFNFMIHIMDNKKKVI